MDLKYNYFIREDYQIRKNNNFLDTSNKTDEYQNDVYIFAQKIAEKYSLYKISDVGCGSGYKLIKYFDTYNTIGYDLKPTISLLKNKYPDKKWTISDFDQIPEETDLVICADVIEHVLNPNELIEFIIKMNPKHIIISTPDRNLLHDKLGRSHTGPPHNKHHVREWSFEEFNKYIGYYFKINEHFNIEKEYNQIIYCTL